jgi:hypothetical protein
MMEWALLGLCVTGWVLAGHFYRKQEALKRVLGESIMLTQSAIQQSQTLIEQNEAILSDLTVTASLLGDVTRTITSGDSTQSSTLH